MPNPVLRGIMPAFPTPIRADGGPDETALRRLVGFFLDNGCQGLVPLGGTGEYVALSPAARARVVAVTVEAAGGHVPVIPGVLSPGFAEAVAAGRDFACAGASGLLLIAPYYVQPGQAGIAEYVRAFRTKVDCPIVFYDIPYKTKVLTEAATILGLAQDGTIIGMKACNTDMHHFNTVAAGMPPGFFLLSGEDTLFPAHMALGAKGGILATAALLPAYWVRMFEAASGGRLAEAIAAQRLLLPLLGALFAEVNPGPLKQAMAMIGQPVGPVLRPLRPPEEATMAALRAAIEGLRAAGVL